MIEPHVSDIVRVIQLVVAPVFLLTAVGTLIKAGAGARRHRVYYNGDVIEPHVSDIVRVIQLVVAPVFLLTAVGTLINALGMRLGRAVDRRRSLERRLDELSGDQAQTARAELDSIARRIRLVYQSIVFAVLCGLFVCMLIAGAFVGAIVAIEFARVIATLFVMAMLALIASLLLFLREIFIAVYDPRRWRR